MAKSTTRKGTPTIASRIKSAEDKLYLSELETKTALLESSQSLAQEDPDESSWRSISSMAESGKEPTSESLDEIRKKSRDLAIDNPHMRGILRNFVKYIIGKGMDFRPMTQSKQQQTNAKEAWKVFCKANKWGRREREVVKRGFRDGEIFIRFFSTSDMLDVRFVDPELIADPDNQIKYGIKTDPNDVETAISYCVKDSINSRNSTTVDASEIVHVKMDVDLNVMRGIPYLYSLHNRLRQYDTWLHDRIVLNKIRASIALLRQHSGSSPSDIHAFAESKKTDQIRDPKTSRTIRRQRIRGGTILDAPKGVDYKFLTPNVDARDVAQDGRSILLSIAAGSGQAEYMVTADASNSNYASTMVSEAPPVKDFEDWQLFFIEVFEEVWERAMTWFATHRTGIRITKKAIKDGVHIEPPRLVSRDRLDEIKGNDILLNQRVMSPQTAAQREGLDFEQESENWDEFEAEHQSSRIPTGEPKEDDKKKPKKKANSKDKESGE